MNPNLFPVLSEDASRILTAWCITTAGQSIGMMGSRCNTSLLRVPLKTVGVASVAWGLNEAIDVVTGFNIGNAILTTCVDTINDARDYIDERRKPKTTTDSASMDDEAK